MRKAFPPGVADRLAYYVYRLIDPRNGETFYVGKGLGNRIFEHANGELKLNAQENGLLDTKMQRIRDIRSAVLEVGHVIHRHGIKDEETAFQIEAAVIDAYPGLANRVGGHDSDFGVAHVDELIAVYAAEPIEPVHRLLLINIRNTYEEGTRTLYDAVRYAWAVGKTAERAKRAEFVLAHVQGLVKEVFKPTKWMEATKQNFPDFGPVIGRTEQRWGFEGEEADEGIRKQYLGKRVPDEYRKKGTANPVRYTYD
jgi:uncharacterized protein